MKPLPPTEQPAAILSFDFDGTLHDPAASPPVPEDFFTLIRHLRETRQVLWGINTGRSMPQMIEGFLESRFPFLPDWVVAREREIFHPNDFGRWVADSEWNHLCEKDIHKLFKQSKKLLADIRREIEEHTGAQWIEMDGEPAGLISRTEEEMEWIARHIEPMLAEQPLLSWQRNSIYLRFGHRDYHKGTSLARVAQHFGLGPAATFAIGDSHNDLDMLDPAVAIATACPANSVPDVIVKVAAQGGYLAVHSHASAAIEALTHYFR